MRRLAAVVALVAVGGIAGAVGGCAQKKEPTRTEGEGALATAPPVMNDPQARMSELRQRAKELQEVASRMPGRDAAQDRQLAQEAFEKSAASLELLAGPNPDGAFRQQLRIIDNTRNFLRSGAANVSADPAIDSGLRSVYGALVSVRQRLFPDDSAVQSQLDALASRLDELDSVRGPLHALVVAQTFEATSKVVDTMAQELEGRANATAQAYPAKSAATEPAK